LKAWLTAGFMSTGFLARAEDVPGQGRGLEALEFGVHLDDRSFGHVVAGGRTLGRSRRGIVLFRHFRAVSLLEAEY